MMTETMECSAKRMRIETSKTSELFSEVITKVAAAKASPAVVSIISHDVPAEMAKQLSGYIRYVSPPKEYIFVASGMVIECQIVADATYLCTVLAPASLFQRPNQVSLDTIKIDVVGQTRLVYNGKLLACDFHYNLAAIIIQSPTPLPTVTFSPISDVLSINPTHLKTTSRLHPDYSDSLDHLVPDTKIFTIWRASTPPYPINPVSCLFSFACPKRFSCNELYELEMVRHHPVGDGGPVLNSFGEVIGIYFNKSSFLPSNILSRWWNHYKSFREFRRPFLGMVVANLHAADLDFLREFTTRFPNIDTAVFVTKVEEDSPAARCGIRVKDVIVKLDGKQVKSKIQFIDTIWENAGQSVEFHVLRVTDGKELNLSLVIEEASPVKFHQWPHPRWTRLV